MNIYTNVYAVFIISTKSKVPTNFVIKDEESYNYTISKVDRRGMIYTKFTYRCSQYWKI